MSKFRVRDKRDYECVGHREKEGFMLIPHFKIQGERGGESDKECDYLKKYI